MLLCGVIGVSSPIDNSYSQRIPTLPTQFSPCHKQIGYAFMISKNRARK